MKRFLLLPFVALAAAPAAGEGLETLVKDGKAALDLRYRYESVEQDDKSSTAGANTLRLRLNLATGVVNGFSAFTEFDHVQVIGDEHHDDTRNGLTNYPVVADPEGTDLNQAWAQYAAPKGTWLRLGRQRIALDGERFIGGSGWRQNEQTFDAFRIETKAVPGAVLNYAYVDEVRRVFGPDSGTPPASLDGENHLLNAKLTSLPVGAITVYGYLLDFDDAPGLSSDTFGLRYDGTRAFSDTLNFGWALEYAWQEDAGDNAAQIDAYYSLVELRLLTSAAGFTAGREVLSGEEGTFTAATNPAFQTPLATLHKWQGWADKFLTTPSAGIEDLYIGVNLKFAGWNGQATWHDFSAEANGLDYGTEIDLSVSRKFANRYEVLVKYANYDADGLFTDTEKFWLQLGAAF
jgi:Alginate export